MIADESEEDRLARPSEANDAALHPEADGLHRPGLLGAAAGMETVKAYGSETTSHGSRGRSELQDQTTQTTVVQIGFYFFKMILEMTSYLNKHSKIRLLVDARMITRQDRTPTIKDKRICAKQ